MPEYFQGKKNAYVCEMCRRMIVTVDRDDGVTPFLIPCQFGCEVVPGKQKAAMKSYCYRVSQLLPASHEWYKPGPEEIVKMSPGMKDHCERGGLEIRRIPGALMPTAARPFTPGSEGTGRHG